MAHALPFARGEFLQLRGSKSLFQKYLSPESRLKLIKGDLADVRPPALDSRNLRLRGRGMNKIFGAAAVLAFAFSMGSLSNSTCCLNRAKAESVIRAQREQTWRYAFTRSSSVVGRGLT
jgi:hypothetical protein